ncbi:MAG: hypothetical protein NTU97_02635 [Candidatus Magasanikbacteria bacterium]|nr:hypothetical protein [Candidatus Magasanikbacteria bacterium]
MYIVIIICSDSYSASTDKHQNIARQANEKQTEQDDSWRLTPEKAEEVRRSWPADFHDVRFIAESRDDEDDDWRLTPEGKDKLHRSAGFTYRNLPPEDKAGD